MIGNHSTSYSHIMNNTISSPLTKQEKNKQTKTKSGRSKRRRNETLWFYFFISPWLIGFIFLGVIPLVFGFYLSLTNYNGINLDNLVFLGLDNYRRAFADPNVVSSLQRTLFYLVLNVPLTIGLSLFVAYVLTLEIPFRGIFRTLFYIPSIVPIVAAVWIWQLIFEKNFGLVNAAISAFVPETAVGWFIDWPTQTLTFLTVWLATGGAMVIFIAGLQGVPQDLKDAAKVDGANQPQLFRNVVIPLLTPVIFFQLILSLIRSLQILVEPILLSPSFAGALDATVPRANRFFLVNTYREIFVMGRFGYGSALVWILFVIILIITVLLMTSSRFWVHYDS